MKKSIIQRTLILLTLLLQAMSAASAADRFFIDAVNIEPGETRQLAFMLENSQEFFGFQADITLPEGLEFVQTNGKPDFKLSSRADASYSTVSNLLANGILRVGAFSTTHTALAGNSGALMYANVHASDDFTGGILAINEILFVNSSNIDVKLPDFTIGLGTKHNDSFYIPDFKIAVGETKTISVILDNETPFTAFQTDVFLPEGLNIVANSFKLTSRGSSNHTVSTKSFTDGRTRIICLSLSNDVFTGDSGALLDFDVTATKDIAETAVIEMKNQRFSMFNAREYVIPNSQTTVTTERVPVESITLDQTSLALVVGDSKIVTATVLPTLASTKEVEWTSANSSIATVSQTGIITAVGIGQTTITATAVDGSGVAATCEVSVSGVPVTNILLNSTSASLKATETVKLTATVSPTNAFDKSVRWESSDSAIATVDADGNVTAVAVGNTVISAISVSNPEISSDCVITVIPTPVSEIVLNQVAVSLQVGATFAFVANVSPETATNKGISWSSDNTTIASIDEKGVVTALSLGKAIITVTSEDGSGVIATATVNVIPTPAESISIQPPASTEFKVGEIISLTADVLPENASDKSVVWSSSDSKIATVNAKGEVSAINVGSVVIKATNSAGISSEISLTVIPTLAESITVLPSSMTLKVNETGTLTVNVTPSTTTNKGVSFESSDSNVASVDENGNVVALSIGEAIITATTKDGSKVSANCQLSVVPTPAESVSISYDGPTSIQVGQTAQLTAAVLPEDATNKSVEWKSQNEGVLTVDANGLVLATGLGEAWVSAKTTEGHTAYITFNVIPTPVSVISLNQNSVSLMAGDTFALTAKVSPDNATDKSLVWSSSNNSVATVSKDGVISGVSVGYAKITVSAVDGFGASAICDIYVIPTPAQSIKIDQVGPIEMEAGETYQLTATVQPEDATDKSVKWSSDAPEIVTVDENGLLYAHVVGNLSITATNSAGQTDVILVNVNPTLAKSIQLNRTTASIKVSDNLQLTVSFTPESTTNKTVTWKSSDASVATVSDKGLVTAHALGNCTVTAITKDGSEISASCNITVAESAAVSIVIEPKGPFTLNIAETVKLTSTVLPESTTDKTVTWQSQTTAVIVDQNGLVTAVAPVENNWVKATNSAGQEDMVYVTVLPTKVSAIKVDKSALNLNVGESAKITATVEPNDATDKTLIWETEDQSVAVVDETGHVTAIGNGETVIRVSAESNPEVYAECRVTVKARVVAVEEIIIDPREWTAEIGDETNLVVTVLPEDASDKTLVWETLDPDVAVVDENGHVTAVGPGETWIYASSFSNPDVYTQCHVTVNKIKEDSELVWDQSFRCAVGETVELTAYSSQDLPLEYTSVRPNGGYCLADIYNEDERSFVTFNNEGAYILVVSDGINSIEKRFNVVRSRDGLMHKDGIYYRYYNDDGTSLMVVRGYEMYKGDYTIPAIAMGLPVVSIDNFAFYSCMSLNDVIIEDGIRTIGHQSFGNGTLHSIAIPSSVKNLTNFIFNALNDNLMSISLYGLTPPYADETTFNGFVDYEKCVLHVPEGTIAEYRDAPIWQNFVNIIDDLPRVTSIEIQGGDLTLVIGNNVTLTALIYPSDADDEILWESSDPTIVSIDESGTITGLNEGVAKITATVGELSDSITVTVVNYTSIKEINYDNVSVRTHDREIIISDMPIGGIAALISIDGIVTRIIATDSSELHIPVGLAGTYVLKVGNRSFKVLVK